MGAKKKYRIGKLTIEIEYPPSTKPEPISEGSAGILEDFIGGLDPASAARVGELEITSDRIKLLRRRRSGVTGDRVVVPLVLDSTNPTEAMLVAVLNKPYIQIDMRYLIDAAAGNERIEWRPLADRVASALWMEWAVKSD